MFQTALRWMGARWWAAAAMAATIIVLFRMTEVGAPSSALPHTSGQNPNGVETMHSGPTGTGLVEASFRKGSPAAKAAASDLQFLELRNELVNLKNALRFERERAALYSQSYEDVSRQYGEISRLAALLMEEADAEPTARVRTPEQRALVERALGLMQLRAHGTQAIAAQVAATQSAAAGPAVPKTAPRVFPRAFPQPASATRGVSAVPQPTEAIFIQTAQSASDSKQ